MIPARSSALFCAGILLYDPLTLAQEDDLLLQETIIVEGSRANPILAGITPENILDFAEIQAFGAASLQDLLADLEPLTQSGRSGRQSGGPAVLLNGRRVSGLREIRNYPPEALAQVEILPEDVAVKFGFQANQKVINFVLRDRFHALTNRSRIGAPTEGGQWFGELDISNLRIHNDGRWNWDLEYAYQDALFESDRTVLKDDPRDFADRSLQAEQHRIELAAAYSHFLPADIGATYTVNLDAIAEESAIAQNDLSDTIERQTDTMNAQAGFVLNKTFDRWNWSVNGAVQYDLSDSETQRDPITTIEERTETNTLSTTLEGVIFAQGFELPAGKLATTLKLGLASRALDTKANRNGIATDTDLARDEANAQLNIDVPLVNDAMSQLPFGRLSLNANARLEDLSDAGTLTTLGSGLSWRPNKDLQILASISEAEEAATLQELGNPISINTSARIFDFATNETLEGVTLIQGGNPSLKPATRNVRALNLSWEPFESQDITLNLDYTEIDIDDSILAFPGLTPDIEAAFPERVMRDANGALIQLDSRPINIDETNQRQIRYGFNWSMPLPRPEPVELSPEERAQLRSIFMNRLEEEDRIRVQRRIAEREARRAGGNQSTNARSRGTERRGGRGGGGRGRGARNGRLLLNIYHTLTLEDSVFISDGAERLDLLNGDAISDRGGTPEHQITAQASFSRGAWGGFWRTEWQSATEIDDASGVPLRFDALTTTDLRLQYNFGNNPRLLLKYPTLDSTRLSLSVENLFDEKRNVADPAGNVPLAYQPDLLDPRGRAVTLRLRKLFY